jgi:hypothetical protein
MTTILKGIAVKTGSTVVHKLRNDGTALIGQDGSEVTLKGSVMLDGVNHNSVAGQETDSLSTILNAMATGTGDVASDLAAEIARATAAEQALQADIDQNEADADAAIAALQADVDQNEADADAAFIASAAANAQARATLQADVDQNEADADTAIAAVASDLSDYETSNDAALAAAISEAATARSVLQSDEDANEAAALAGRNAIQADEDANEAAASTARGLIQADEDANEATALAGRNAIQADEDANEATATADRAAIRSELATAIAGEVSDRDTAITAAVDGLVDGAPEALDTLNELAAAIGDDEQFFQTTQTSLDAATTDRGAIRSEMATQKSDLQAELDSDVVASEASALAARQTLQSDVDGNESDFDTAAAALQTDVDGNESDFDTALAALQADVDGNESDADTAIAAVASDLSDYETSNDAALVALQADVDGNESDADTAIAAVASDLSDYETDNDAALAALQADVDGNESDFDTALAALQADVDQNEADADAAFIASAAANAQARAAIQADVDQNESDADAAFIASAAANAQARAAIQADVDQNESDADTAIAAVASDLSDYETSNDAAVAALQADVDGNESDFDTALAALQSDVDGNESDFDAALATVQADVDQNETDSDASHTTATTDRAAIRSEMSTAIAQEVSDRDAAITAAVDGLVDGAPELLDTLNELAAAIGDDENFATTMTTALGSATTDRALIRTEMATQKSDLQAELDSDVAASEASALAARQALQSDIDQNETDFDTAIAAEQTRSEAAYQAMDMDQFGPGGKSEARAQADAALGQAITAEETARIAADAALGQAIAAEETARVAADAAFTTQVQSLAADGQSMNLSGLASVGSLESAGIVTIGDEADMSVYTNATDLANGDFDGMMVYYTGAGESMFPMGNKYYSCEDGVWHPWFFTPGSSTPAVNGPQLTVINGDVTVPYSATGNYVDDGASATDVEDGNISHLVQVSGDVVNLANPGVYTVTYTVTDTDGNVATANRTVTVEPAPAAQFDMLVTLDAYAGPSGQYGQESSLTVDGVEQIGPSGLDGPLADHALTLDYDPNGLGYTVIDVGDPGYGDGGVMVEFMHPSNGTVVYTYGGGGYPSLGGTWTGSNAGPDAIRYVQHANGTDFDIYSASGAVLMASSYQVTNVNPTITFSSELVFANTTHPAAIGDTGSRMYSNAAVGDVFALDPSAYSVDDSDGDNNNITVEYSVRAFEFSANTGWTAVESWLREDGSLSATEYWIDSSVSLVMPDLHTTNPELYGNPANSKWLDLSMKATDEAGGETIMVSLGNYTYGQRISLYPDSMSMWLKSDDGVTFSPAPLRSADMVNTSQASSEVVPGTSVYGNETLAAVTGDVITLDFTPISVFVDGQDITSDITWKLYGDQYRPGQGPGGTDYVVVFDSSGGTASITVPAHAPHDGGIQDLVYLYFSFEHGPTGTTHYQKVAPSFANSDASITYYADQAEYDNALGTSTEPEFVTLFNDFVANDAGAFLGDPTGFAAMMGAPVAVVAADLWMQAESAASNWVMQTGVDDATYDFDQAGFVAMRSAFIAQGATGSEMLDNTTVSIQDHLANGLGDADPAVADAYAQSMGMADAAEMAQMRYSELDAIIYFYMDVGLTPGVDFTPPVAEINALQAIMNP